jgi:hypothetical protein
MSSIMAAHKPSPVGTAANEDPRWLELVRRQVASLRFGVVQIVVHNAQVTQIERTERLRLDAAQADPFSSRPDNWR